jgi:hypothetical protein
MSASDPKGTSDGLPPDPFQGVSLTRYDGLS